jgi:prolipoprotein diacylglyceryltransferase
MKEHVLRGIVLIIVFFSYFAWRINMLGFNLIVYPFALVAAVALGLIIKMFCRERKDNKKRNQDRVVFITILVLFLVAVLIRILFLS